MTYTVTADLPTGDVVKTVARSRDEADDVFGGYLRDYPHAEVVLRDGDNVLVSVGSLAGLLPSTTSDGGEGVSAVSDEFRERVISYLDATSDRWATLDARHALDVALDISGQDDPFEGATIQVLESIVNEWFCEQGRP